jgi:hypothetical protein
VFACREVHGGIWQDGGVLKDNANLHKVQAKCQKNYDMGTMQVKKQRKQSGAQYGRESQTETPSETNLEERLVALEKLLSRTQPPMEDNNDAKIMGHFTLQSEYAFVARVLSQLDGVGKGLDPKFDFISAAAPNLVEVNSSNQYLVDEMKKRLKFI